MFLRMFWRVLSGAAMLFMIAAAPGADSVVSASGLAQRAAGPIPAATQFIVTQITMTPPSPNILPFGQDVNFTFNYRVSYPAGVRIFTRPFSGATLNPNYSANPSGIYPTGSGIASGFFTILSGESIVDRVRFEIVAADTGAVLEDYFLPVHYQFSGSANMPYQIDLTPQTPNLIMNGQNVSMNYHYRSSYPGGIRIFPRPMSGGNLTPGYGASGSGVYMGTGTTSDFFGFASGTPVVDQIHFEVTSADQSVILGSFLLPVSYQVTSTTTAVSGISLTMLSPNPNILDNNQNVNLSFNYTTTNPGGVRIFARPMSMGNLSMGYSASGSPLYATGSGSGSGTFTITSGTELVDGIRFEVLNADQSTLLFEKIIPVYYLFGGNLFRLYGPYMTK